MDKKRDKFSRIIKDIKSVKVQGARNIAKSALKAYNLIPLKSSKNKLLYSRPTEPMMHNVLNLAERGASYNKILKHFDEAQAKINQAVFKLIKNNSILFIHCHSTNVINSLIYSKKKGKKFEIYNTETRPLYQGRKTAKELSDKKIKLTMFIDSALDDVLTGKQGAKKPNLVLLGADALLKNGIINKIGSELIAKIARQNKIPVYIVADSWKFSKNKIPLEQRSMNEVWDKAPKNIKIKNPAFEFIDKKYVSGIVTEFGLMKYGMFVRKMMKKEF
jgi:translation initiation factor 2B subunit (eIF-2B alpha/beta/delta family)